MGRAGRVIWVDVAKGIAIVLVVLFHATIFLKRSGFHHEVWPELNQTLAVLRMPLFFASSGLFAASVVARPWRVLWATRLSLLVWVFLLWSLLRVCYFSLLPDDLRTNETGIVALLAAPLLPTSALWFLHALVAFFVVAKLLTGRVGVRTQLGVAALLSMTFLSLDLGRALTWEGMGRYFVFFLAGLHARETITKWVDAGTFRLLGLAALAFVTLEVLGRALGWADIGPFALLVRLFGVGAGFLFAAWIARTAGGRLLGHLGRNSLPVYLAHALVVVPVAGLLGRALPTPSALVSLAAPVMLTVLGIAVSLGLHAALRDRVTRYAYEQPAWFADVAGSRDGGVKESPGRSRASSSSE